MSVTLEGYAVAAMGDAPVSDAFVEFTCYLYVIKSIKYALTVNISDGWVEDD